MRKTLRKESTENSYKLYRNSKKTDTRHLFERKELVVKKWEHWQMIENTFPYDLIAEQHYILFPTRQVSGFFYLNPDELGELAVIQEELSMAVDMWLYNSPQAQSVPDWFHLHLLKLIDEPHKYEHLIFEEINRGHNYEVMLRNQTKSQTRNQTKSQTRNQTKSQRGSRYG